jgi:hypothetical protein
MIRRGGNREVTDESFTIVDETWRQNKIHIWGKVSIGNTFNIYYVSISKFYF